MKTLVVTPTPATLERLKMVFMNAPLTIDWATLLVPLATGVKPEVKPTSNVYQARVKQVSVLYDKIRQTSELVAVLDSPEMAKRSIDCGMAYDYLHKLILVPYAPALSQPVRNFLVSVSDTLVLRESHVPFTFQTEYLLG